MKPPPSIHRCLDILGHSRCRRDAAPARWSIRDAGAEQDGGGLGRQVTLGLGNELARVDARWLEVAGSWRRDLLA